MIVRLFLITVTSIFFLFTDTNNLYADSRLDNCNRYKEYIISILLEENVSPDYFYLAVCESGCKNKTSPKGAKGFFQLTKSTYNVYRNSSCSMSDIDNIRCNTIAAARYIKHLSIRFKDIKTLIKAYNRGGTNLQRYGSTKEADSLSRCVLNHIHNSKH